MQASPADIEGYKEFYAHCEDVLAMGYGFKKDSGSDGSSQHGRKDRMHDKEPTTAELFEQALTGGSSWGDWAHAPSSSAVGDEVPPDMQAASSIDQLQVRTCLGKLP